MALVVSTFNDIKCYNLSAGKSSPQFFDEAKKKKKSLRYNEEFRRRVEILQDFEFPSASTRVKVSRDGQYVCASGIYKPEMRMYDTLELGMKFSRHIDAEVVDMQFLSDDYKKVVLLGADRSIEFHAQYGRHHKVRIPKVGRSLFYDLKCGTKSDWVYHAVIYFHRQFFPAYADEEACCLFVGGSCNEVYRLDLEQGQFLAPLNSSLEFVNQVSRNPQMPLLGCAGSDGTVEFWDVREPKSVAHLQAVLDDDDLENGRVKTRLLKNVAVGTSSGISRLFDLRSHRPLAERDQRNGLPVRSIRFHAPQTGMPLIASMDDKCIKFWSADENAKLVTTVESEAKMNDFAFCGNSGLLFAAKLKMASEPFAYEEYRKKKISEKVEARRKMRITAKQPKVAVNENLHKKLRTHVEDGTDALASQKGKKQADKASALLTDARFRQLFSNPDFEIENATV